MFLKEVLAKNNISLKDILEQNIISDEFEYSGILMENPINIGIEEAILSYYHFIAILLHCICPKPKIYPPWASCPSDILMICKGIKIFNSETC